MTPDDALARQVVSGLSVALAGARETGRPYAFDLTRDGSAGSNRDAALPPFGGFERVHVIHPGFRREDLMGLCKRVYTARSQGWKFSESILRTLSPQPTATPEFRDSGIPELPPDATKPAPEPRPAPRQAVFAFD